ncbi:MAG: ATP-dependent DNA helicase [Actinomycetota bacterium]
MIVPTAEQEEIITAGLMPLRVSAGAGTGKTTTVALRVAHLIANHDIAPEQVLGITFTNKAAAELADRIRQELARLMGKELATDPGREVEVHTYHGFAAQILREFGALVGIERDALLITPTYSRQLLFEVVAAVPLPHLNVANPFIVEDIRRLGSALGDHLLSPEQVTIPVHAPDDPWVARADLLVALAHYDAEKRRLGVVDYSDLIVFAHRLVTSHPDVAREIRSRYRAVMLDEYQDTNPAQRRLIQALFGAGFPVTAVGDADQTIYEWRGASPSNFERFPDQFPAADGREAPTLPLSQNRRSLPNIIDLANRIKGEAGSVEWRLKPLDHRIGGEVVAAWHPDAVVEAEWIARQISILSDQHQWREMAILFRKNKDMILVHDALRAADIPVEVANLGGLLAVPEVADLRCWLRILHNPSDGPALYRLLMGSRFRLGIGDVVKLADWVRAADNSASEPLEHDPVRVFSLVEAIEHIDELNGLRAEAEGAMRRFGEHYRHLLAAAQGVSLVELCRQILDRTGAWNDLAALPDSGQLTARLNLYRFLDLTEEWSPLEGRPSLGAFVSYLDLMERDQTEELDTARLSGENAVTLVTVHRAKGLEWEVVFLPACYHHNFPSGGMPKENPYKVAKYLPYEYRVDREWLPPLHQGIDPATADRLLSAVQERQEWRIAYVAVTRAKQRLFVSGASWYGHPIPRKRPVGPSRLWEIVSQQPQTRVESRPAKEPPPAPLLLRFEPDPQAPDPHFPQGWTGAVRHEMDHHGWAAGQAAELDIDRPYQQHLQRFQGMLFDLPEPAATVSPTGIQTSVTGMVTYAQCPKRFFWSEVERLPRRPNPAARRGTEIHRLIELHNRRQLPITDLIDGLYDAPVAVDEASLADGGAGWSKTDPLGAFKSSRFAGAHPLLVEQPFELGLGSLRIKGRVDAVYEPKPGHWEIVDFKSGRRPDDPSSKVQLEAYAVAADTGALAPSIPTSMTATFAYLSSGLEEVSEVVDGEWLRRARSRLSALADAIADEDYHPRPSPLCAGCDFLTFCPEGQASLR